MKLFLSSFLLFALLPWGYAQEQLYTEIRGAVESEKPVTVTLYATEEGATRALATAQTGPDGSYGFLFVPASTGFYLVGINKADHLLYLRAGDRANVNIRPGKAVLTGVNTKENVELYKWLDASEEVRNKAGNPTGNSTFKDFFPEFESLVAQKESIRQSINSGNPAFDELLRHKMDYDLDFWFLSFLYSPRSAHPEKSDRIPYYETIVSDKKFVSDEVLKFPEGIRLLRVYLTFNRMENEIAGSVSNDYDLSLIPNPTLKGEYLLSLMKSIQSYDKLEKIMDSYKDYFITPAQKEKAAAMASLLYESTPGKAAINFAYPDTVGEIHSLSDYQGKVVVVDVWATWCAPCRKQFPFLKALEKKMQGKEVVFIAITIDKEKDKDKWKSMIVSENLQGVQLFAGDNDRILKEDYKIKAIPRYMVIDKKGNIVSVDAPRPDSPELQALLEKELRK
jgi:thiol-disulfide isomerase/thioredoxin